MTRQQYNDLLQILGKRLREGEDALHLLTQMEALPESPAKTLMVQGAAAAVEAWAKATLADVKAIGA